MDHVQLDEQGPFEQKISVILGVTEWVKNGRGNYRGPQWPRMQSSSASGSRTENSRPAEGSSVKISLPALERIVPIPVSLRLRDAGECHRKNRNLPAYLYPDCSASGVRQEYDG
jgi:hypothetical protein